MHIRNRSKLIRNLVLVLVGGVCISFFAFKISQSEFVTLYLYRMEKQWVWDH